MKKDPILEEQKKLFIEIVKCSAFGKELLRRGDSIASYKNREDVKDAYAKTISDVAYRLWGKKNPFIKFSLDIRSNTQQIKSYMKTCMRNNVLEELKNGNGEYKFVEIDEEKISHEPVELQFTLNETKLALGSFDILTTKQRIVIDYRYKKGLTGKEIGRLIGKTKGAVTNRIHKAIKNMRAYNLCVSIFQKQYANKINFEHIADRHRINIWTVKRYYKRWCISKAKNTNNRNSSILEA